MISLPLPNSVFECYADRVKNWITIHDRLPERLEDVWCSHNILLAHARAVKIYRDKYQVKQGESYWNFCWGGEAQNSMGISNDIWIRIRKKKKKNKIYAKLSSSWISYGLVLRSTYFLETTQTRLNKRMEAEYTSLYEWRKSHAY